MAREAKQVPQCLFTSIAGGGGGGGGGGRSKSIPVVHSSSPVHRLLTATAEHGVVANLCIPDRFILVVTSHHTAFTSKLEAIKSTSA